MATVKIISLLCHRMWHSCEVVHAGGVPVQLGLLSVMTKFVAVSAARHAHWCWLSRSR
jgi:hypothetical protein